MTRTTLAPGYDISRVLKGGWQLAGGHGAVDSEAAMADMDRYVEAVDAEALERSIDTAHDVRSRMR